MTITVTEGRDQSGRVYFSPKGSHLKFSTREVAERHAQQAAENMARFRATVAADTPEQRTANMRAFFGIKEG